MLDHNSEGRFQAFRSGNDGCGRYETESLREWEHKDMYWVRTCFRERERNDVWGGMDFCREWERTDVRCGTEFLRE